MDVFEKYVVTASWEDLLLEDIRPNHLITDLSGNPRPSPYKGTLYDTRPGTKMTIMEDVVERWTTPLMRLNTMPAQTRIAVNAFKHLISTCDNVMLFGRDEVEGDTEVIAILSMPNIEKRALEKSAPWIEFKAKMFTITHCRYTLDPVLHTRTVIASLLEINNFMGCKNPRELTLIQSLMRKDGAMSTWVKPISLELALGKRLDQYDTMACKPKPVVINDDDDDTTEWDQPGMYMEMADCMSGAEALVKLQKTPPPSPPLITFQEMRANLADKVVINLTPPLKRKGPATPPPLRPPPPTIASGRLSSISCGTSYAAGMDASPTMLWRKRMVMLALDHDETFMIIKKNKLCAKCHDNAE